jgi:hypothetical protein
MANMPESENQPPLVVRRQLQYAADEIAEGLVWLVTDLDYALPHGFEGKAATAFGRALQTLKANAIQHHIRTIVDALYSVAEGLPPEASVTVDGSITKMLDNGLRAAPVGESSLTRCNFPTMGFATEAIDRFVRLMRSNLKRAGADIADLDDVDQAMVSHWRGRWEESAGELEGIVSSLKNALVNYVEKIKGVDPFGAPGGMSSGA